MTKLRFKIVAFTLVVIINLSAASYASGVGQEFMDSEEQAEAYKLWEPSSFGKVVEDRILTETTPECTENQFRQYLSTNPIAVSAYVVWMRCPTGIDAYKAALSFAPPENRPNLSYRNAILDGGFDRAFWDVLGEFPAATRVWAQGDFAFSVGVRCHSRSTECERMEAQLSDELWAVMRTPTHQGLRISEASDEFLGVLIRTPLAVLISLYVPVAVVAFAVTPRRELVAPIRV